MRVAWGVLAALSGIVLSGLWLRGGPGVSSLYDRSTAPEVGVAAAELEALRAALADEVFAREQLSAEVELMRAVLSERADGYAVEVVGEEPPEPLDDVSPEALPTEAERFDQVLVELGFVVSELKELRGRRDKAQLAKLELTDRARREGWLHRPRYRHLIDQVDSRLRVELGEEGYERMLIATGQPNRVQVRSILRGSAAAEAGVEAGDYLVAYAGQRVFAPNDVRRATAAGVKGESVQLRVERAGRALSFVVPRGPLGLQMFAAKSPPR